MRLFGSVDKLVSYVFEYFQILDPARLQPINNRRGVPLQPIRIQPLPDERKPPVQRRKYQCDGKFVYSFRKVCFKSHHFPKLVDDFISRNKNSDDFDAGISGEFLKLSREKMNASKYCSTPLNEVHFEVV